MATPAEKMEYSFYGYLFGVKPTLARDVRQILWASAAGVKPALREGEKRSGELLWVLFRREADTQRASMGNLSA